MSATSAAARSGAYLNYAVAKSLFTIQVTAASAAGSSTASGAKSATDASTGNPPPTTWTLTGTLTQSAPSSGTQPQTQAQPKTQAPPDASECAVLTAQYTSAQTAVAAEIAIYAKLTSELANMAAGSKTDAQALSTALQSYVTAVSAQSYQQLLTDNDDKTGTYAKLIARCPTKVKVSVQQTIVPDATRTFALKPRTNIFYADQLTLKTDANGFLTEGAPTSTSQVTAIASAVANDVGLFAPVANLPSGVHSLDVFVNPCPAGLTDLNDQITALPKCQGDAAAAMARAILLHLTTPGALKQLPSALLPLTLYARIEDLETTTAAPLADQLRPFGVQINLGCSDRNDVSASTPPDAPATIRVKQRSIPNGVYDGLVVSISRACLLEADQGRIALLKQAFWAQDSRGLVVLPTQRGFLVQRSIEYDFANGQATGVTDSRPSEALAFVSFPGTVLGSFFAGVTSAVNNSQVGVNGQTARITAQTDLLTAQTNNLAAQAALAKQQAASAAGGN